MGCYSNTISSHLQLDLQVSCSNVTKIVLLLYLSYDSICHYPPLQLKSKCASQVAILVTGKGREGASLQELTNKCREFQAQSAAVQRDVDSQPIDKAWKETNSQMLVEPELASSLQHLTDERLQQEVLKALRFIPLSQILMQVIGDQIGCIIKSFSNCKASSSSSLLSSTDKSKSSFPIGVRSQAALKAVITGNRRQPFSLHLFSNISSHICPLLQGVGSFC